MLGILSSFDKIACADYIFKCFGTNESWIRHRVNILNSKLKQQNKPLIKLGLVDVLPPQEMYQNNQQVLVIDYWLRDKSKVCDPLFEIPKSVYGIYYMPNRSWHRTIHKDLNCFINSNNPIRQSWFYLLYDRNLLDRGYVSFSGHSHDYPDSPLNGSELFDDIHRKTLQAFDSEYDKIKKLVPFKNFVETGNLCDTIMSTKFSIVIDSYFHRTDALTFTEKTFRVLQTPRPWLLFHTTGSIASLRSLGFYVYDDLIDHSYDDHDTTTNHIQRQQGILSETKKLLDLNVTDSLLDHWEKMTLMNCNILQEYHQTWKKDCEDTLIRAYEQALSM